MKLHPVFASLLAVALPACGGGEEPAAPASSEEVIDTGETPAGGASKAAVRDWDSSLGTAALRGVVRFDGTPPRRRKVDMGSDPQCHAAHAEPLLDESVVVGPEGNLANVFVWVKKGLDGWRFPVPDEIVTLDQNGCNYVPHVLGVRVGQTVHVRNSDPVVHNVHSYSRKNPAFNQSQQAGSDPVPRVFARDEVMFTVKCDLHGWMSTYLGVVDHPYFAVTGEDGSFTFENLPPGDYTVEAIHEVFGKKTAKVTLGDGLSDQLEFTFVEG